MITRLHTAHPIVLLAHSLLLILAIPASAQRPQDNWYSERTWTKSGGSFAATNGGLSAPYGVAVGPDGRVYVGDEGYKRIQVYEPDGTYVLSITNGVGGGQSFSQPRGMIFGPDDNLYVTDQGLNKVFVFNQSGAFVRAIGTGTGTGPGQMTGAHDVGVSREGEVFVLETSRVSVFSPTGDFLRSWSSHGTLSSQIYDPESLAVSANGRVYISTKGSGLASEWESAGAIRVFTAEGLYYTTIEIWITSWDSQGYPFNIRRLPCSLRFDSSGLLHAIADAYYVPHEWRNYVTHFVLTAEGTVVHSADIQGGTTEATTLTWPCAGVGRDGRCFVFNKNTKAGIQLTQVFRDNWAPPRNTIPQPNVFAIQQRPDSSLVDIDYQVTDMDDTNVYTAALIFKNGAQAISNCIRTLTLVEGTATNLGPDIAANQPHRLTWNAGADWGITLGSYRVAIVARDSRPNLLDIHYLRLPAGNGMPALTISRSPLIANDYMQVWWWLLATGDTGIGLSTNRIVGVGEPIEGQILCDGTNTTSLGRSYIFGKLNVREATAEEVTWARQAALPGNTNKWTASPIVSGRPKSVNEYGFDTGSWGSSAFWVVPLD